MKTRFALLSAVGVLSAVALIQAGGWAVTTVDRLPDYAVVGQPVQLAFTVRQHGLYPASNLPSTVQARLGSSVTNASARETTEAGRYVADLALTTPGTWSIEVRHGFGTTTFSLPVVAAGSPAPKPMEAAEQGLRLFAAKGCLTCHVHQAAGRSSMAIGPELTGRRYPADVLAAKLAHPLPCESGKPCMPVLGIRPDEAGVLAAFLNAPAKGQVVRAASGQVR